jgi:predicted MarR family transcription regulator
MTYDLRRLRVHGLIERIPHSHRYRVTDTGLHAATLLTRVNERLLPTGLAQLTDPAATPSPLRTAARAYQTAIDELARQQGLAA